MTRKDYIALAQAIWEAARSVEGDAIRLDGVRIAAKEIARTLAHDNPRFDRARFMRAAGFEE